MVDLLRELWVKSWSGSDIAKAIGTVFGRGVVTRNAVIGKAHRIGLPKRPSSHGEAPSIAAERSRRYRERRRARERGRVEMEGGTMSAQPKTGRGQNNNPMGYRGVTKKHAPPRFRPQSREPVVDVKPLCLPLVELQAGDCRYVVSDGPALFCALPAISGTSWCLAHHRIVYRDPYRSEDIDRLERIARVSR